MYSYFACLYYITHSVDSIEDLGFDSSYQDFFGSIPDDANVIVSPSDYKVQVVSGGATLLLLNMTPSKWSDIIEMVGELSATSKLELNISSDPGKNDEVVIGSITKNPLDDNNLVFNVDADTLPTNTLVVESEYIPQAVKFIPIIFKN